MRRRRFLQLSAASALGAFVGCGDDELPPILGDVPWGVPRPSEEGGMVPAEAIPEGVLEVFMMGGLNPWDTFYVVPEHGDPKKGGPYAGQQWWTYQEGPESVPEIAGACEGGDRPLYTPFGTDEAGRMVHLGPWLYPLRDRQDIIDRMRLIVVRHELEPHEAATPFVLGGQPRGTPRMASTGSHIQRFWQATDATPRDTPYSYVVSPSSEFAAAFNAEAAFAIGSHPGRVRPLSIRITRDNPLARQLKRERVGGSASKLDDAVDWYRQRWGNRLLAPGAEAPVASRGVLDFTAARSAMRASPELAKILTAQALEPRGGSSCGYSAELDPTSTGLELGVSLLTSPVHRPRFVHVVDSGLIEASDGGYDTHQFHVRDTSRNAVNMSRQLAERINKPGENDPKKLDLDRHMVLVTTEMGRTPYPQEQSTRGLNHWPYGFVVAVIGGPGSLARKGVVGSIGEDARAVEYTTPGELRAAMLLAQGVWPFSPESFAVSDVRGASGELMAAEILRSRVLGFGG